ncbi:MAG: FAD:protein FMN transferase [Bacillota bacterium]|nr:FAD:protein FMN transferase [Bacillota bacterium]
MKKQALAVFLCLTVLFASALPMAAQCGEPKAEYKKYSYMFFNTFDTVITIIGYAEKKETFDELAKKSEDMFTHLHRIYNQYLPYEGLNNLYYVNANAATKPVKVPPELFELIAWCKEKQPETNGKVNIALGAVLSLWHDERELAEMNPEKAKLPDMDKLKEANLHTSMDDVILNEAEQTIYFKDPRLKLDLGAVAKGYATEIVARMLLSSPMPSFIINAGGNVRTGHPPLDGRTAWGIGIQNPDDAIVLQNSGEPIEVLYLSDRSLVTSGDYQRYYTVDGQRYHHLISPDTLMPATFFRSVTIITEDSGIADLLSTAVFLMPVEEGQEYIKKLDGVDALWILNDGSIVMTEGAQKATAPPEN